jgi:hypothetical protein
VAYLVTLAELKDYLGDAPASSADSLLTELISNVQSVFEAETGHSPGSFIAAGTGRTEVKDGTGSANLYLDYPVAALTSVKLGYDPASPDETLDVTSKLVIVFSSDSRRISTDRWRKVREARPVSLRQVVYDNGADLPDSRSSQSNPSARLLTVVVDPRK